MSMRKLSVAAASVGMLFLAACGAQAPSAGPSGPPPIVWPELGETAPDLAEGRTVYDKWCATCHSPNGRMPGTIALEAKYKGELAPALVYRTDLTPETVELFVRQGVSLMAPFRKTEITDAELQALGEFLSAPLADRGADEAAVEESMAEAKARQEEADKKEVGQ